MTATDNQAALTFYRELARRLATGQLTPEKAAHQAGRGPVRQPVAPEVVRQLLEAARRTAPRAPREGWALAHVAHTAAQSLTDPPLVAEATLALAVALNTRGEFKSAIPLAQYAAELLVAHACTERGRSNRQPAAARCYQASALAHTELRQPRPALEALAEARALLDERSSPVEVARCNRLEAQVWRYQGRSAEAVALLERARETFAVAGQPLEVARCDLELARALYLQDPTHALDLLDGAYQTFEMAGYVADTALCEHYRALALQELNRYAESLVLLERTRAVFTRHGMDHFVALSDAAVGIGYIRLNRYEDALTAFEQARAYFAAQDIPVWVAMCDVNLAVVDYFRNRYSRALSRYAHAVEAYLQADLPVEAARCHENMALVYAEQGRYDRALTLHQRARETFAAHGLTTYVAMCEENMAGTYHRLGCLAEALRHYRRAREAFAGQGMSVYVAYCNLQMGNLYRMLDQPDTAWACLERARATCRQEGMTVHVAACDREMALVQVQQGQEDAAFARLARAKAVFGEQGLLVDAALCDLAEGEMHLQLGEPTAAVPFFEAALEVLEPGFPDEAWRAWYGLGQCALAQGDRSQALAHWLAAVERTNRIRVALPTERLRGGFFADRRQLYEESLELALEVGAVEQALAIAEAGKAQTFRVGAGRQSWREAARDDLYLAELVGREERLRGEMAALRRELRLLEAGEAGPVLRGEGKLKRDQPQALARLAELGRAYEGVVERLRLAAPGWVEAHSPVPFSVQEVRRALATHLPGRWACLNYYVLDDTLVTFYLDAQQLTVHRQSLSPYDRLALRQCTDPAGDFRELIYRGTLRGYRVPGTPGRTYLQHLYRLLIPPAVKDLGEKDLLIIVPHGRLHGLAFQALLAEDGPLVARVPLVSVPSLGALQALLTADRRRRDRGCAKRFGGREPREPMGRVLVCGLSDFGPRATPLPRARDEVAALRGVLGERLRVLWGTEATREALLDLNDTGELARYDGVHFATHAVLDSLAPSQSGVLLADGSLALADVLNLKLGARMVVLSACEGAMGQRYPGDEIMGLARAFHLAGARTVVASLWPVEDASAGEFMGCFYRHVVAGQGVAQALRAAQVEMAEEGYVPYQWTPFITMGCP